MAKILQNRSLKLLGIKILQPSLYRTIFSKIAINSLQTPHIPIKNRQFLPGSTAINLPEYIKLNDQTKLNIIKPQSNTDLQEIGVKLRKCMKETLSECGAILVKSLPISSAKEFQSLLNLLDSESMKYVGGSGFRKNLLSSIYSASDEPNEFSIELHNEMSYLEEFPTKFLLCCISEGYEGGESPICFNRDIMANLDKNVIEKVTKRRLRYLRNLPHEKGSAYITWQTTFDTKSKKEAEFQMTQKKINWQWNSDDSLAIWNILDATTKHPVTSETVWFNQLHANHCSYYQAHPDFFGKHYLKPHQYPYNCCYGDGEEIEDEVIEHVRYVTWKNAVPLKLEKGDLLILDNLLCQHSRMSFKGPRKILVCMLK